MAVVGQPHRRSELLDRIRRALNSRARDRARRKPSDHGAVEA